MKRFFACIALATMAASAVFFVPDARAATNRETICSVSRRCDGGTGVCGTSATCNATTALQSVCSLITPTEGRCLSASEQSSFTTAGWLDAPAGTTPPPPVPAVCCLCGSGTTRNTCVTATDVTSCGSLVSGSASFQASVARQSSSLSAFACDAASLSAANCRQVAEGGRCQAGPLSTSELGTPPPPISSETATTTPEQPFVPIVPTLGVPIPGLVFTAAAKTGESISIPYIAQYIVAVYRYLTGIAVVAAIIMVTYGGFRYLIGSTTTDVKRGKDIIGDAVIGLMIMLGAYVILNTINPSTLTMKPLELTMIQTVPIAEILEAQGSMVEDLDYGSLSDIPASASAGTLGSWRRDMLALCGQRNGFSLPTMAERVSRYRQIVAGWADIGGTQGGAIYLRGGEQNCSSQHADYTFLFDGIAGHWPQAVIDQYFPQGSACRDIIMTGVALRPRLAAISALHGSGSATDATVRSCLPDMTTAYQTVLMRPAQAAGLLCGDCATFTYSMLQCFGRGGYAAVNGRGPGSDCHRSELITNPDGTRSYPPNPRYAFRIWLGDTPANQRAALFSSQLAPVYSNLQFGDVIIWHRAGASHVFSYTGRAGLPYEIIEMGGGGRDDQTAGGRLASRNAGLPYQSAGVRTHPSAMSYIQQVAADCIWAIHTLDPNVNPVR